MTWQKYLIIKKTRIPRHVLLMMYLSNLYYLNYRNSYQWFRYSRIPFAPEVNTYLQEIKKHTLKLYLYSNFLGVGVGVGVFYTHQTWCTVDFRLSIDHKGTKIVYEKGSEKLSWHQNSNIVLALLHTWTYVIVTSSCNIYCVWYKIVCVSGLQPPISCPFPNNISMA